MNTKPHNLLDTDRTPLCETVNLPALLTEDGVEVHRNGAAYVNKRHLGDRPPSRHIYLPVMAITLTVSITLTACNNNHQTILETTPPTEKQSFNDPAEPVRRFNETLALGQYDEMRKCVTKEQTGYIDILEKAEEQKKFPAYSFREDQRIVVGNVAKIWHNTPQDSSYITVVVKQDGVWKVDFLLSVMENNK